MYTSPIAQPCHDREEIADTLTAAFTDDPVYHWAIPLDLPERGRYLHACMRAEVDFALDHGGGAAVSQDRTGVTLWHSPDTAPGLEAYEEFYERIAATAGPAAERCLQLAEIESGHPAGLPRHVYSGFTGVVPGAQGRGTSLGLAMAVIAECRDRNAAMFALATCARNAALWARYGAYQCGETMLLPDGRSGLIPILIDSHRIEEALGQLHELAVQRAVVPS
ncbi:GNAT superfamily N-acetyltransferase [Kitasatospora gansuensis]|uniref:GNAT superfamily N-acetyltransferase n=1 Tax=Kitasatospora gansuensis TaxID=258050 RepID=A0A7W7SHK4_9ACTN|nr:hypothetical protein [Kitasatospora gansuensis]MBB4950628.1 GNAT superfamily N-acetyltransferase [Kitasatospora gansuensis]